jgi:type III pantothenate kinase
MKLLIDIGNSCIKWQFAGQNVQHTAAYKEAIFTQILSEVWQSLPKPDVIWVSNVAGSAIAHLLTDWTQQYWQCSPHFAKSQPYAKGVKNGYTYPEILGIDRWLAIIAAYQQVQGAVCVIDCGTAVTIDMIDAQGQHQGGMISAGLETMQRSLLQATYALAKIPKLGQEQEIPLSATETHQGIALGSLYALIGLIESVFERVRLKQPNSQLILTGGSVPQICSLLRVPYQYQPNLVLQGLAIISDE